VAGRRTVLARSVDGEPAEPNEVLTHLGGRTDDSGRPAAGESWQRADRYTLVSRSVSALRGQPSFATQLGALAEPSDSGTFVTEDETIDLQIGELPVVPDSREEEHDSDDDPDGQGDERLRSQRTGRPRDEQEQHE